MLGDWNQEPEHSTLRDRARTQHAENWEPKGGALGARNRKPERVTLRGGAEPNTLGTWAGVWHTGS